MDFNNTVLAILLKKPCTRGSCLHVEKVPLRMRSVVYHPLPPTRTWYIYEIYTGADPGFPIVGGANPLGGGAPTYDFAKFCEKLHEIRKILGHGGVRPGPQPPKSATGPVKYLKEASVLNFN